MHDIDDRLLDMFKVLDKACRDNNLSYIIEDNSLNSNTYVVNGGSKIIQTVLESCNKFVDIIVDDTSDNVKFEFKLREDWLRSPTRRHIRRQSSFPQSYSPSKSFGGIKGYNGGKFSKKLSESLKLSNDLIAHDNATVIPKDAEVDVVDPDPSLPDVKYQGTTINVDKDKLKDSIDKGSEEEFSKIFKESFIRRIDKKLPKEF